MFVRVHSSCRLDGSSHGGRMNDSVCCPKVYCSGKGGVRHIKSYGRDVACSVHVEKRVDRSVVPKCEVVSKKSLKVDKEVSIVWRVVDNKTISWTVMLDDVVVARGSHNRHACYGM